MDQGTKTAEVTPYNVNREYKEAAAVPLKDSLNAFMDRFIGRNGRVARIATTNTWQKKGNRTAILKSCQTNIQAIVLATCSIVLL